MANVPHVRTIQSNIRNADSHASLTNYALFMGGTNVTHDVLAQYDPLKTGYSRISMVREPTWVKRYFTANSEGVNKFDMFKHIVEYGNTNISGLGDVTVDTNTIQGGYVGKSFEIPSVAQDNTNSLSIQVYEFTGSPIREVLHTWINGTTDLLTGLTHYNGYINTENPLEAIQANQSAEFIYMCTDCTGQQVEYACMFANCFPKGYDLSPFNYSSGTHDLVEMTIEFTATKYESIQINQVANRLLQRYKVLGNSLNFYSGINADELGNEDYNLRDAFGYNVKTGQLDTSMTGQDNISPTDEFDDGASK